jgi:hypothetical protein
MYRGHPHSPFAFAQTFGGAMSLLFTLKAMILGTS